MLINFKESVNYLEYETDNLLNNIPQENYDCFDEKIYDVTIGNYLKE